MSGTLASIWRYPVKGFTPEQLPRVELSADRGLAFDRAYAVEDGPSGFDPAAPKHISKQRFTVLAKIPAVARVRTRFEDRGHVLHAEAEGHAPIAAPLEDEAGRASFASWLTNYLGDSIRGPLRVLPAPGAHRFYDDELGHVSLINLASVRDLAARLGRPVDPLRFRGNLYVEGWPAWVEMEAKRVTLDAIETEVFKPIRRCVATHVDPATGVADIDVVGGLMANYGHPFCGLYLRVTRGGVLSAGEPALIFS